MDGSADQIPTLPPPSQNVVLNFVVGMLVTSGMYFVYVTLLGVTVRVVTKESRGGARYSALAYLFLVFFVYTMNVSSLLSTDSALLLCGLKDQTSFSNCRLNAVLTPSSLRRLNITGATAIVVSALADLLSIYRTLVLYQKRWIVVVPSVLMLALSIGLFAWAQALPDLAPAGLSFAVFGLLGGVDLLTSGLIISRLSYYRHSIRDLGKEHQKHYASLMSIFVESSALVSIPRILNAILQFTKEGETSWSQSFANGTSAIGPLLIILRIALQLAHTGRSPAELGVVQLSHATPRSSGLNQIIHSVVDYDRRSEPRNSGSINKEQV